MLNLVLLTSELGGPCSLSNITHPPWKVIVTPLGINHNGISKVSKLISSSNSGLLPKSLSSSKTGSSQASLGFSMPLEPFESSGMSSWKATGLSCCIWHTLQMSVLTSSSASLASKAFKSIGVKALGGIMGTGILRGYVVCPDTILNQSQPYPPNLLVGSSPFAGDRFLTATVGIPN